MENLNRVLRYYEDIILGEDGESNSLPYLENGVVNRIRKFFDGIVIRIFGQDALLKRRSNRFLMKLIKVERECSLNIQNKIILVSKVITFCHETFGFAPRGMEKMLVRKVEEMKHAVVVQLN